MPDAEPENHRGADPILMQQYMRETSRNLILLNKTTMELGSVLSDAVWELETFREAMKILKDQTKGKGRVTLSDFAQAYWGALEDAAEAEEEEDDDEDGVGDSPVSPEPVGGEGR